MGHHRRWGRLLGAVGMALIVGTAAAKIQEIEYRQDPDAAKRMTLPLKDWTPKPMLRVDAHEVRRAKFYVIEVHNHVNDARGLPSEAVPPAQVVAAMDAANVRKIVI